MVGRREQPDEKGRAVDERPVWRQLFEAWEKEFGPRLEEYVQTDEFAERMAAFQQINRHMTEMAEEATRQFLRFWNLPTASDLEKVSQQLAEIDRRLRALNRPVEQQAPAPGPRKRQGSMTAAGMKAAIESREAAAQQAEAAAGGGATVEIEESPSSAGAAADTSTASDPTVIDPSAGDGPGANSAASASKAKASRRKVSKAKPAKASASAKSSAPAHKAESQSSRSGYRRRGTEGDAGNKRKGKA